jgi:hypothetical protein
MCQHFSAPLLHQILHITMAMRCCVVLEQNGTMLQQFWLFTAKNVFGEDDISTAVTASLKRPSTDKNRAAIDRLPRRWEKCVDSAGDSIE